MSKIFRWSNCQDIAHLSHGQWGDDVLAWDYLGRKTDGVFLEAGANDPIHISQSYFFEQQGWRGMLVEPVPSCCEELVRVRTRSQVFQAALGSPEQRGVLRLKVPQGVTALASALSGDDEPSGADELVEARLITISEVMDESGFETLDFLSLDLEGMELDALRGLDFSRYAPRLIVLEDRMESLAKHRFLKANGYKIVMRNGSNNWYVPKAAPFEVPAAMRFELVRKLYLSAPFRLLRDFIRIRRRKGRG